MSANNRNSGSSFQVTDRRFWVQDESLLEKAPIPETKYPSFVEELKARTQAAEQKLQEKVRQLDAENSAFRERLSRRLEQQLHQELAVVLEGLLEVADNLERALTSAKSSADLESLQTGVELTLNLLQQKLQAAGLSSPQLQGEPFDPAVAEAVGTVEVSDSTLDGKVMEVLLKPYVFRDRLLRPGKVRVGRLSPTADSGSGS